MAAPASVIVTRERRHGGRQELVFWHILAREPTVWHTSAEHFCTCLKAARGFPRKFRARGAGGPRLSLSLLVLIHTVKFIQFRGWGKKEESPFKSWQRRPDLCAGFE